MMPAQTLSSLQDWQLPMTFNASQVSKCICLLYLLWFIVSNSVISLFISCITFTWQCTCVMFCAQAFPCKVAPQGTHLNVFVGQSLTQAESLLLPDSSKRMLCLQHQCCVWSYLKRKGTEMALEIEMAVPVPVPVHVYVLVLGRS